MAHEPILILDPDPVSRTQLTEILTTSGYDVYGVKSADRLVEAVKASPFPCVMIDVWLPNIDRGALIQAIRDASRMTAILMMGEKQIFSWLLEVFREGANDFVLKPFDPIQVRERVDKALQRRQQLLERQSSRQQPPPAPPATPGERDHGVDELLKAVIEFQEQSLEVFLNLERKNLDLERELAALRDPGGPAKFNRNLQILVAHSDSALSDGLEQAVTTFDAELLPQAFSGGEVLDRIGDADIDIVVVGAELPDIPGSMVASTVKSQLESAEVLLLETLVSGEMQVELVGDADSSSALPIASQQDLVDLLKDRCRHVRDRREARQFARDFKGRHQEYIRSLAGLKSRIENALE